MPAHADGHANEVRLVPGLLSQVRDLVAGSRLWVGDRAYSYPERLKGFVEHGDAFLYRLRSDITFTPDADHPARKERDRSGRRVRQEWGWLGRPADRHRIYVRRVTLDRGEEESVVLVTNLLDERSYPVTDLLDLYLLRWGIERVFQQVTEVFSLKHLIAWTLLIGPVITAMTLRKSPTPEQASAHLHKLLQSVWTKRWIKAPPQKRKPARQRLRRKTHVSVHKVLVAYDKRCGRSPVGKR